MYNLVTQYINPLFAKFNKSKIRRLSKEGGIILLGQANSILTSLILVRLLTETLLPAEYGKLSLALSVGPFVCQIAFAVSMPGIGRYFALAIERVKQYEFYKASMQMMLYSTIISITLIIVLLFGFEYFDIINMKVIVTMSILYLIISNYNTIFTEFQNVARQRHIAVFHSFLDSWLKIGLVFLLVHFFFNKAETIVTAYIFSLLIVLASQKYFLKKVIPIDEFSSTEVKKWKKKVFNFSKPFLWFNIFTGLQSIGDKWSLAYFTNKSNVGFYAPLTQLGYTPLLMIAGLTTTLIGPILFMKSGDGTDSERNSNVKKITILLAGVAIAITFLCFLVTLIFHKMIFNIFVAKEYHQVSHLLPWMVISGGLFSTAQIFSLKLMSDLKTKALILPKIISSLLGVGLSILGAYYGGINGIVIASVTFSLLQFIWLGIVSLKTNNNPAN